MSDSRTGGGPPVLDPEVAKLITRRSLLRRGAALGVGMTGAGALLAACGGGSSNEAGTTAASTTASTTADAGACGELNLLTWQGYTEESAVNTFAKQAGIKVTPTYIGSADETIAKLATGADAYDATTVGVDGFKSILGLEAIDEIDTSQLSNWDDIFPTLREALTVDGKVWGVPDMWDVNPFLYNSKELTEPPESWEILWDPALKGQIGVWDDLSTLWIAANVLGLDDPVDRLWDLSDEELEAIGAKLEELKPNIRVIWSDGGELINLMANGEVKVSLGWNFIYNELKKKNAPIERLIFENHGAHAWWDAWSVISGGDEACRAAALEWINWTGSPEGQATTAKLTGYMPVNPKAADELGPELTKELKLDNAETLLATAAFKEEPVNRERYQDVLNRFKASVS